MRNAWLLALVPELLKTMKGFVTQHLKLWIFVSASLIGTDAQAGVPEGTWKFERSADYFRRITLDQAPKFETITFRNGEVRLSENCIARVNNVEYYFPEVFQPLTQQDVTEDQVDHFLLMNFSLSLSKAKSVYKLASKPEYCENSMKKFFAIDDKILFVAGATFYTFAKAPVSMINQLEETAIAAYKFSRLPLDYGRYYGTCRPKIVNSKGKPQTSDKCAPDYFPYVADSRSSDPIMKMVGNHDYIKGGSEYGGGFSPPFKQKTAATFLVFPPMKKVTLIRVDDFEVVCNEMRDTMTGVYLSIMDGKVVDQIQGCHFNRDYVCIDGTRMVARLTENGKFQKVDNR